MRRARFLILVSLGYEDNFVKCERCEGFGRYVSCPEEPDLARVVNCAYCRAPWDRSRGYYDETLEPGTGIVNRPIYRKEVRAIVRRVAMHQSGHWMVGSARAFGHRLSLSGTYGADVLTVTVPREVFDRAVPIPDALYEAWSKGGGHNSSGSEGPSMREWALANLDKLESTHGKRRK